MKLSRLAYAIPTLLVATSASAAPELSGRAVTAIVYDNITTTTTDAVTKATNKTTDNRPTMKSGASFLAVKGSTPISDETSLDYHLEYNVNIDGGSDNFTSRFTQLSLNNKQLGKLSVGRALASEWYIRSDASYFYTRGTGLPFGYDGQWVNNTIIYQSPKFNDSTQLKLQYTMNEGGDNKGGKFTTYDTNGVQKTINRDYAVGTLTHKVGDLELGAAGVFAGSDFKAFRGNVSYTANDLTIGAVAQHANYASKNNELGGLVSAEYKLDEPLTLWAQTGYATNYKGRKDSSNFVASTGAVYKLAEKTSVFGTASMSKTKDWTVNASASNLLDKKETGSMGVEVGVIHKF